MRPAALALAAVVVACTPAAIPSPPPTGVPSVATTEEPTSTPTAAAATTTPASPAPTAAPAPDTSKTFAKIALKRSAFPILPPSGTLTRTSWTRDLENGARYAIDQYLLRLDEFRKTDNEGQLWGMLPAFKAEVVKALRETARPGVERKFQVEALRVDAVYQKPWGSNAIVEVTATIRDKVVSGTAQDETETGRLRLGGDSKFSVIDGWDYSRGRWFNGFLAPARATIEMGVADVLGWYLQSESWVPATPNDAVRWLGPAGQETPFVKARNAWLATFDRARTTSRLFEEVTAELERFEPGTELSDGIATVRIDGTVATTDASGATTRAPFQRRVRLFVLSWGTPCCPVVVDEEATPGVWRAGGTLALKEIDRQFG